MTSELGSRNGWSARAVALDVQSARIPQPERTACIAARRTTVRMVASVRSEKVGGGAKLPRNRSLTAPAVLHFGDVPTLVRRRVMLEPFAVQRG